ncbi:MAG: class I SAM-dependent methyltransferase [Nitrosarchaeum sp.]|nr:class I SAM-dependent methyltransferase [Nitrosarchaeum sp.]
MNRSDIINFYVEQRQNCQYLEVGVGNLSANFNKIKTEFKDGADPVNPCNNKMTSDEFFAQNTKIYDVIFVDGDHKAVQATKDIANALKCIKSDGVILVHDCNPLKEEHQTEHISVSHWNGSVWKSILFFRQTNPDILMYTIDADEGICVIRPNKKQELFKCDETVIDFNLLCKYRKQILNLVSLEEWMAIEIDLLRG